MAGVAIALFSAAFIASVAVLFSSASRLRPRLRAELDRIASEKGGGR